MREIKLLLIFGLLFSGGCENPNNSKGMISDSSTGLMWQDNHESKTIRRDWHAAMRFCEKLTLGGYSDWSLPTHVQLFDVLSEDKPEKTKHNIFKNIALDDGYWSSSTHNKSSSFAWATHFGDGYAVGHNKGYGQYIRCNRHYMNIEALNNNHFWVKLPGN